MSALPDDEIEYGYWVVAFLDLLGQRDAFLKTDYLPSTPAEHEEWTRAARKCVGAIEVLHQCLEEYAAGTAKAGNDPMRFSGLTPDQRVIATQGTARSVLEVRWSDGVVFAAPLAKSEGHNPVMGIWQIVLASAAAAVHLLASGIPLRGGIELGTGFEKDGQVFGAAVVKAYDLEKRAGWPRVLVGPQLAGYVQAAAGALVHDPVTSVHREVANRVLGLICADEEGLQMLDFAGPIMATLAPSLLNSYMFESALRVARTSRGQFGGGEDEKLFDRYSKLVRYLDLRAKYWDPTQIAASGRPSTS